MSEPFRAADPFQPAAGGKARAMALLRVLAFAVASVVVTVGLLYAAAWSLPQRLAFARTPEGYLTIVVASEALGVIAATAMMARLGRRSFGAFGLAGTGRARNFLIGLGAGALALSLVVLVIALTGAVSFSPETSGRAAAWHGVFYAALMLAVAFAEEGFCRGYGLVALSQGLSFWPAALVSSVIFAGLHGFNEGETAAGVAAAALFGLMLAYSYRGTGSLWFAYGFHGSWDFAESFVFGVPNSGITFPGGLLRASFQGPAWLTGGTAGPEGSVLTFLVLGAAIILCRSAFRSRRRRS